MRLGSHVPGGSSGVFALANLVRYQLINLLDSQRNTFVLCCNIFVSRNGINAEQLLYDV